MDASACDKQAGRTAFGLDPAGYDRSRPDYPEWVFDTLRDRCDVREGTSTFEIGAGTGKATRRLLAIGANPLIAIEPDARLADFLTRSARSSALRVINSAFEDTELAEGSFDLGTSATAFHWLEEDAALRKIADALRVGGWWAPFWNSYGDASRFDPFHEATERLLSAGPGNPSNSGTSRLEFGADVEARAAAIRSTGAFDVVESKQTTWTITLDAAQTVELYASYSNVSLRPDREDVLAELGRIAREEFADRVTRNVTTTLYLARRGD